jgi:hypothetical protein
MAIDLISELVRIAAERAQVVKRDAPEILACGRAGRNEYGHLGNYSFLQSAYFLGYMSKFRHPRNTLFGQDWCTETALAFTDLLPQYLRKGQEKGEKSVTAEWSPLGTLELLDLLKPDGSRRADWLEFVESYIGFACERPYGFTSPNHEAWRQLFLHRAGQILNRPKLCELAVFFCRQELQYQTPEGFWEEGKHHGPSMAYNTLMLEPLAWLYRYTNDPQIGQAAGRLGNFMASWCFPDGCTVGAFDGRQSTGFGFGLPVCPGLELTPQGRTLNHRGFELFTRREAGYSTRGSAWYDHFALFFYGTAIRYYSEMVPASEIGKAVDASAVLPADADGTARNHTPMFDGLLARRGKWCLALSSQNSDIPRQAGSIFRLERSSRIELWHQDARLVLGGGHNRKDWPVPYANVILDTGFAGQTQFGLIDQEKNPRRRSYYLPHWVESHEVAGRPELSLHFGHGTVRFQVSFESDMTARIEASWNVRCVQRLCLQLPLVVWRGASLLIDGAAAPEGDTRGEPRAVSRQVEAQGGLQGQRVALTAPQGAATRLHYPLGPLKYYIDPVEPDSARPLFAMALLSSQWTDPAETGSAAWTCTVAPG